MEILLELVKRQVLYLEDGSYDLLKEIYFESYDTFSENIGQLVYGTLNSFCGKMIKDGIQIKQAFSEKWKIMEIGLNSGLFNKNGFITEVRYLNILDVKTSIAPWDDHEEFINEWLPKTLTKDSRNLGLVTRARTAFARRNYELCLDNLNLLE